MAGTRKSNTGPGYGNTPGRCRNWIYSVLLVWLASCGQSSVYEKVIDFKEKAWVVTNRPQFSFEIKDYTSSYNLYYTLRNSLEFPFSRVFVNYTLSDSTGMDLRKELVYHYLFDQKTGRPTGSSGLGDLHDHSFPLVENYKFERPGRYTITLEQFNRKDTLEGILAVGVRIEKTLRGGKLQGK